jgi:3-dehydroquinate dehydratase-1
MAQLVSSKNLLLSSRPLCVGVVSHAETLANLVSDLSIGKPPPCDVVEIRLDLIELPTSEIRSALQAIKTPILLTSRHPAEGGQGELNADQRMSRVEPLLDLAGAVDIELRSVTEMKHLIDRARSLSVPVIGSFHDFQATPPDEVLEGAISFGENAGLAAVKIAAYLNSADDLSRLLKITTAIRRLRLSVMGMGPWGRVSRLVLAKGGSLLNYGFLGESNAPGQWPAEKLKDLLAEI